MRRPFNAVLLAALHDLALRVQWALALLAVLVAASPPSAWLTPNFGWDGIVREPAAVVPKRFQADGSPLARAIGLLRRVRVVPEPAALAVALAWQRWRDRAARPARTGFSRLGPGEQHCTPGRNASEMGGHHDADARQAWAVHR